MRDSGVFYFLLRHTGRRVCVAAWALALSTVAWCGTLQRVEPPNWWVGMRDSALQLMLHGDNLAGAVPTISYSGVQLRSVQRSGNPNYLWLNLEIEATAKPGVVDLVLHRPGAEDEHWPYRLQAREAGSAERRGFSNRDVILNLMPDRFARGEPSQADLPAYTDKVRRAPDNGHRHGGNLAGLRQHLDYLGDMGYTMLWPTPLVENNQPRYSYHGYAVTDHYRIDPRFGSNDDYGAFVREARARGMGVIQDLVLNHIGSGHWWMRDPPSHDWLSFDGRFVPTHHARTAVSDPYAARSDRDNFTQGWFEADMPDMNQRNPLVATYQIQNALWWIESAGLSGLRVDTYGYCDPEFLSAWSRRVMLEYPHFNIVGEEWSYIPVVIAHWLRGRANADGYVSYLPSVMDFPLHRTLREALVQPETLHSGFSELYEALVNDRLYPEPRNLVLFEGNHDVPRLFSALGDDPALVRMALVYVLTMHRIPQLYYGTEILMTSPRERDDGATRNDFPGGWAGDPINAFTAFGLSTEQRAMQSFVRRLLRWRQSQPVIHNGALTHFAPQDGAYVYFRTDAQSQIMVAFNKKTVPQTLATARFAEVLWPDAQGRDVITGVQVDLRRELTLPARSALVLEVSRRAGAQIPENVH